MKTKKACHTHSHMRVAVVDGQQTVVWNWSCLPHGIWRKTYRSRKGRDTALKLHIHDRLPKKNK